MKIFSVKEDYKSILNIKETEVAIKSIKDYFEEGLAGALNLTRVSAPLFVRKDSGINDNLNGVERPVAFDALSLLGPRDNTLEIVQSLAKWKRMALRRYQFEYGEGLYTDMNAIRRDETVDNLHSMYVDQWDWERVIKKEDRNIEALKSTVRSIYKVFLDTEQYVYSRYPEFEPFLPHEIFFISSQELENMYPDLTPKDREDRIAKDKGAVFIMQIGDILESGNKHDGRSPDYDDWKLNGDIVFWYPVLECAFELSSMGIRVDEQTLVRQLEVSENTDRLKLPFHQKLIKGELPYTIGGGIGQSRICMFFLRKAHIGEVQASVWSPEVLTQCEIANICLL